MRQLEGNVGVFEPLHLERASRMLSQVAAPRTHQEAQRESPGLKRTAAGGGGPHTRGVDLLPLCGGKSSARRRLDYFWDLEKRRFSLRIIHRTVCIRVLGVGIEKLRHFLGHACTGRRVMHRALQSAASREMPASCAGCSARKGTPGAAHHLVASRSEGRTP